MVVAHEMRRIWCQQMVLLLYHLFISTSLSNSTMTVPSWRCGFLSRRCRTGILRSLRRSVPTLCPRLALSVGSVPTLYPALALSIGSDPTLCPRLAVMRLKFSIHAEHGAIASTWPRSSWWHSDHGAWTWNLFLWAAGSFWQYCCHMPYIEMCCDQWLSSQSQRTYPFIREFDDSHAGHMLAMFCTHHEQKSSVLLTVWISS